MKKALSLFLAMLMLISVFSVSAFAATAPVLNSAIAGYYGVELKWSAAVGASGYGVYRLDSADAQGELIDEVTTTSYVDKKVAYGETYKYVVASKNADGSYTRVDFDNAVKVTYNRVQLKKVTNNYDGVNLVWNATPASKNGYRIFRQEGSKKPAFLADVKTTSYVDTTVKYSVQYKYAIVSLNECLEYTETLDWDNAIKVNYNLVDLKVPTVSNDGVKLTWTKVDGATGYDIYRKSNKPDDKGALIGSTTDVCSFTDKTVEKGVTYNYCVIVKGSGAKPDYANGRSVKYAVTKFLKHINQFDGLKLEWTPVPNASKYYLKKDGALIAELDTTSYLDKKVVDKGRYKYSLDVQYKNGDFASFSFESLLNTSIYTQKEDLEKGIAYTKPVCSRICLNENNERVHMFDTKEDKSVIDTQPTVYACGYKHYVCAECGMSSSKEVITQLAPKTPDILMIQNTNLGVKVTWEVVDSADLYVVYRRSNVNGVASGWKTVKFTEGTYFYDKNVQTGGYYRYAVMAVNRTNLATRVAVDDNDDGSKTVYWAKDSKNANAYYVYRKDNEQAQWKSIDLVYNSTNSFYSHKSQKDLAYYKDTNPSPEIVGYRALSVLVSARGSGEYIRAVKTPEGLAVKNNTTGILFGWKAVPGATYYRVYRKLPSDRYWTHVKSTKNNYYPDYDTEPGETYIYTVKAVSGKVYSDYIRDGVKITRLTTPKLVSAKSSKSGITVTFEPVVAAQRYNVYRKTAKSDWSLVGVIKDTKSNAYLDTTAKKGVTYTYTVRALDTVDNAKGTSISSYQSGITCKDLY